MLGDLLKPRSHENNFKFVVLKPVVLFMVTSGKTLFTGFKGILQNYDMVFMLSKTVNCENHFCYILVHKVVRTSMYMVMCLLEDELLAL